MPFSSSTAGRYSPAGKTKLRFKWVLTSCSWCKTTFDFGAGIPPMVPEGGLTTVPAQPATRNAPARSGAINNERDRGIVFCYTDFSEWQRLGIGAPFPARDA